MTDRSERGVCVACGGDVIVHYGSEGTAHMVPAPVAVDHDPLTCELCHAEGFGAELASLKVENERLREALERIAKQGLGRWSDEHMATIGNTGEKWVHWATLAESALASTAPEETAGSAPTHRSGRRRWRAPAPASRSVVLMRSTVYVVDLSDIGEEPAAFVEESQAQAYAEARGAMYYDVALCDEATGARMVEEAERDE